MALVAETKRMIMKRGAKGIVGIQRIFKICDDDGSGQLDKAEFTKACRQFKLEVGDEQINDIFQVFDGDKSGTISFDEFLRVIKGDLNE
jgi:Ca2+-binding EF-hand superfamily protein